MCELLLQFNADPWEKSSTDGSTPLCCAVAHGHFAACQVLIDAKSDVNHRISLPTPSSPPDETPARATAYSQTVLGLASENSNSSIVDLLLEHRAAPNVPDTNGITPLYCAVQKGHLSCVIVLLNARARTDIVPLSGVPLLAAASHTGNERVRKLLKQHIKTLNWEVGGSGVPPQASADDSFTAQSGSGAGPQGSSSSSFQT